MADCTSCAGTGTTVIAVIALILIIIFIIIGLVFFFFPSTDPFIQFRGVNFNIQNGTSGPTDTMRTGSNNLYISSTGLTGTTGLTLTIESNSANFVGMTIAVKNNTVQTINDTTTIPFIQLVGGSGVTINPGGIYNNVAKDGTRIGPGGFAWLVCTSATSTAQTFLVLENTNPAPSDPT